MIKFRTEFKPERSSLTLSPLSPVVLAGSCFSINMAEKMNEHGWKAVNPTGTLYNPFSIVMAIDMMLNGENGVSRFEKSLFQYQGIWNSTKFGSSFSSPFREDCIEEFKIQQEIFTKVLKEGKTMIITFGTAICHALVEDRLIVGNCHKMPSSLFYSKRLTASEILSCWDVILEKIKAQIPDLKVIFTVSPVRHLKDGFVANARSKSILLLGVEEICSYNEGCYYFPAYEILNDDLRDYRFYASDLVHPSEEAIEYIWEIFKATYLDAEGKRLLEEGLKAQKLSAHRPKCGALGKPLSASQE